MAAAVGYDLLKARNDLDFGAISEIAIGFAVAFVTALFVVKAVLGFVGKHGYAVFGWWRIIVGSLALAALLAGF